MNEDKIIKDEDLQKAAGGNGPDGEIKKEFMNLPLGTRISYDQGKIRFGKIAFINYRCEYFTAYAVEREDRDVVDNVTSNEIIYAEIADIHG